MSDPRPTELTCFLTEAARHGWHFLWFWKKGSAATATGASDTAPTVTAASGPQGTSKHARHVLPTTCALSPAPQPYVAAEVQEASGPTNKHLAWQHRAHCEQWRRVWTDSPPLLPRGNMASLKVTQERKMPLYVEAMLPPNCFLSASLLQS